MRLLKSNEIEVRVGMCKEKGASLLLYKNARVDMQLMDETFGPEYWKREHIIINNNNYCRVSVFNKDIKEWVSKEDCGTESITEKEKGEASDSFKRACVNWGIGRELYTAPFTWITNIKTYESKGKWKTFDKFTVKEIDYNEDREIKSLIIVNQNNVEVFVKLENKKPNISTPTPKKQETKPLVKKQETKPLVKKQEITQDQITRLYTIAGAAGKNEADVKAWIKAKWKYTSTTQLTKAQYDEICKTLEALEIKKEETK